MKKPKARTTMKKLNMRRTQQREPSELERMCQELGDDAVKSVHEAYRLTATSIFRSAKKRAEAEMKMADQYRTLDADERRGGAK